MNRELRRALRGAPREIKAAFRFRPPNQAYMIGHIIVVIAEYLLTENGVYVVPYSDDPQLVGGPGTMDPVPIEYLTVMQ